MKSTAKVNLYSVQEEEIAKFLDQFYNKKQTLQNPLKWEKDYENPIEMVELIGVFIENAEMYHINMWISLDQNCYINVTENNADKIIRYLYERYPH